MTMINLSGLVFLTCMVPTDFHKNYYNTACDMKKGLLSALMNTTYEAANLTMQYGEMDDNNERCYAYEGSTIFRRRKIKKEKPNLI